MKALSHLFLLTFPSIIIIFNIFNNNIGIVVADQEQPIGDDFNDNDIDEDDVIMCSLCSNSSHIPQDPFSRFVVGSEAYTCQTAYELGPLELPQDNCTFWQSRGETICQCAEEPPPDANDCTLCESGTLPSPLKEGIPGKVCSAVQVDAKRGDEDLCVIYQQTIGIYCGCDNPIATHKNQNVCRLCGGTDGQEEERLPVPLFLVPVIIDEDTDTTTTSSEEVIGMSSCVELEFEANLPGANCKEYQELYGKKNCCLTESPTKAPKDGVVQKGSLSVLLGITMSILASGLWDA